MPCGSSHHAVPPRERVYGGRGSDCVGSSDDEHQEPPVQQKTPSVPVKARGASPVVRSRTHVAARWEPSTSPWIFGFRGECRALTKKGHTTANGKTFRLFPCEREAVPGQLYCVGHQGTHDQCNHPRMPEFYTIHDLNKDLNDLNDFVNFTYLPFKLGIWLKENEIRKAVFERIGKVKVLPLKAMCVRLGIEVESSWRKIEYQRALLTVVGHPCFKETLEWCLREDGQQSDAAVSSDHAITIRMDRQFGDNKEWWARHENANAFEDHQ